MTADGTADSQLRPVGDVLDGLGIQAQLADGELIEGDTRLSMLSSDGLGWIERSGMLRIAEQMESNPSSHQAPEDD